MFNIVLLEPEIPANTGNIGRTCLVTGSRLHLIEPMGFILNDKNLKRAGMDYWKDLDCTVYDSWRDFVEKNKDIIDFGYFSDNRSCCKTAKKMTDNNTFENDECECLRSETENTNRISIKNKKCGEELNCAFDEDLGKDTAERKKAKIWMATTKAKRTHVEVPYRDGDFIMFGKESAGIPEEILMENEKTCVRIPMAKAQRSLNLSNSVAVVLYEALRHNDFLDLETEGQLHEHVW